MQMNKLIWISPQGPLDRIHGAALQAKPRTRSSGPCGDIGDMSYPIVNLHGKTTVYLLISIISIIVYLYQK